MSDLSPPPPPPPLLPTPPPGEQVQATIPGIMRTAGFLGVNSRLHTLVITNQRLIFARLTGAELKRVVKGLSEGAKAEGKDWKGRMRERAGAYQALADECAAMNPDDLLAQHQGEVANGRQVGGGSRGPPHHQDHREKVQTGPDRHITQANRQNPGQGTLAVAEVIPSGCTWIPP